MPCNSDYLAPSHREQELQKAAKLLLYILEKLGKEPEAWLVEEAGNVYARDERSVTELCTALKAMNPQERDALVYNAHEKNARDLADWWEEHQAADAERERQEAAEKDREENKKQALAKLSEEERKALGL